jgi:hypothetical protein
MAAGRRLKTDDGLTEGFLSVVRGPLRQNVEMEYIRQIGLLYALC